MPGGPERGEPVTSDDAPGIILTPDQRLRVFVSSTLEELAPERRAVRRAIEELHLAPVLFELGARPYPPRSLYRSYLEQSHVFLAIYWQRYGWVAPGMEVSGLEDEHLLAGAKPKLIYVKRPAPDREERLEALLDRIRGDEDTSYKPFADAEELEQIVADDLALLLTEAFLESPESGPSAQPRHLLPADASPFVGRAQELDEVRSLLERDDVRLVTLTGPGGIGKTRLALRVAAQVAPDFVEGAAFVSLAAVRDPQLVPATIAAAIGLRDEGIEPIGDVLRRDLADRSLLLVLDNLEHVLDAADLLPELLESAPRLKVLVTSRAALRVRAEHEVPVPPLAPADAVRLFGDRARAARFDFDPEGADAATITAICERLEHIPLAIELAAARARVLPPQAVLERLEHRLDFLVSGARDLPERQRALRDTIRWSVELLDEAEADLLTTLGAFSGSFSLGAVEAVHGPGGSDVLDLLAALVDNSLLRAEATAGEPRFRMLTMIHEFAAEQLAASGREAEVRERHADHFRQLSQELGAGVRGPAQRDWLRRFGGDGEGDADNLRVAAGWYLEQGRVDDAAEMAWALVVPTWVTGRLPEGRAMAQAALAAGGDLQDRSRARLLLLSALFDMWRGDHERTVAALREAIELGTALGDDEIVSWARIAAAMSAGPLEGEARAEELADEAAAACRRRGDLWGESAALNVLGWLYVAQERFVGTEEVLEATVRTSSAAHDEQLSALAEVNLAELRMHEGDLDRAEALLASCRDRHRSLRSRYSAPYLLDGAARLAALRGDPALATRLLSAATALRTSIGIAVWGSQADRREALCRQLRDALGDTAFDAEAAAGDGLCYSDAIEAALPSG